MSITPLLGKYETIKENNFDAYYKAYGLGLIKRKLSESLAWTGELSQAQDGTITMKTSCSVKSEVLKFKLDVPFEQTAMNGKKCQTTFTLTKDNELIQVQKFPDSKVEYKVTRKMVGDEMHATFVAGDVVATAVCKRVK